MSDVSIGTIASNPNERGEHSLICPNCSSSFLSTINKNDETGVIENITCPICKYSSDPKHFIAAAHQAEVNDMAIEYVVEELKKAFKGQLK